MVCWLGYWVARPNPNPQPNSNPHDPNPHPHSHPHPHQVEFALLHSSLPAAKGWNACSSVGLCLCLVGKA